MSKESQDSKTKEEAPPIDAAVSNRLYDALERIARGSAGDAAIAALILADWQGISVPRKVRAQIEQLFGST